MTTKTTAKPCSRCKREQSIDDFYRDKTTRDGHRPDCKDCVKKTTIAYYYRRVEADPGNIARPANAVQAAKALTPFFAECIADTRKVALLDALEAASEPTEKTSPMLSRFAVVDRIKALLDREAVPATCPHFELAYGGASCLRCGATLGDAK